jgi:hypothetical protein
MLVSSVTIKLALSVNVKPWSLVKREMLPKSLQLMEKNVPPKTLIPLNQVSCLHLPADGFFMFPAMTI